MNQEEADKIAAIIRTADSGCSNCVGNLCDKANAARLGFEFVIEGEIRHVEQPEWSTDPDDAMVNFYPNVVTKIDPPAGQAVTDTR